MRRCRLEQGVQNPDVSELFHELIIKNIWLYEALNKLTTWDKYIIMQPYFKQKTETELAKELGVSQAFVYKKIIIWINCMNF